MRFDSKNIFWILLNVGIAAAVVILLVGASALWRYGASLNPARTITVSAAGEAVTVPDIARVSFAVVSEGADPVKIQEENAKKVNAAIGFVKKQGIETKDVKTSQYSLSPQYEYDEARRRSFISGYVLRQSVEIKIRDFEMIRPILAGLPAQGVNEVGQLQFDIDNPDSILNLAREEAFSKARAKAKTMARQNGVSLGRVVNFSESTGFPPIPYFAKEAVGFGGDVGAPVPTIEPGQQEVTVNVSVTYEIR